MRSFAAVLSLFLLSSCAWPPSLQWPSELQWPSALHWPPGVAPSREAGSAPQKSARVDTAPVRKNVRRLLRQEKFVAALDAIGTLHRSELQQEYLQAFNAIVTLARTEQADGDPARAGEYFRSALNHYPPNEHVLTKSLPMSKAGIEEALGLCAEKLMEQGLKAYRAGSLEEAIHLWNRTLVFLPGHEPTRKALSTAQTQLENLEALEKASVQR